MTRFALTPEYHGIVHVLLPDHEHYITIRRGVDRAEVEIDHTTSALPTFVEAKHYALGKAEEIYPRG